jgi:hypothetical protein
MYYKYVSDEDSTYYILSDSARFIKEGLRGTYIYHSCYDGSLSSPINGGLFLWEQMKWFELVDELPKELNV